MSREPSTSTCGWWAFVTSRHRPFNLKRYHRTLKDDVNQVPYEVVENIEAAIRGFVQFYKRLRARKWPGLVVSSPVDLSNLVNLLLEFGEECTVTVRTQGSYQRH